MYAVLRLDCSVLSPRARFNARPATHQRRPMNRPSGSNGSLVLSYLGLRKAVGIIGTALPFVLALGKILLEGPGIQSSISSYYHTGMRDVFVGSLCAIAVFLISYHGYEQKDDIAGDLACVFALGVALFPTTPEINVTPRDKFVGRSEEHTSELQSRLHLVCRLLLEKK